MRRNGIALIAFAVTLVTSPAQAELVVLKPGSPWNVDFGVDKCRLVRLFGEGDEQHMLAFQQYWPARNAGLTVAGPEFRRFRSLERTSVKFFDAQEAFRTTPFTGSVEKFGTGVIFSNINIAGPELEPNEIDPPSKPGTRQMDVALGAQVQYLELRQGSRAVRLETGPLDEAFKVMNQCTLDLLRDWGLDTARHLTASTGPRWINQAALTRKIVADYPAGALAQGEQAIMRMRVIVGADGNVESCVILKATDTKRLESPACNVMQRARFEPARDAAGQPFRSFYVTSITYKIG